MAEPNIWLQDDEPEGQADCGCILQAEYDGADDIADGAAGNPAYFQCPLHAAAPELLAALYGLTNWFDPPSWGPSAQGIAWANALNAIAKARGPGQNS